MKPSDFYLRNVTVVIISDESHEHDYSNIHHQFLVSRGVIPSVWEPHEPVISPPFSQVEYKNGVQLAISGEVLRISHTQESHFDKRYEAFDIAVKYLASMKPTVYDRAVMNWRVVAKCDDSRKWITEHFFRPEIISSDWENFSAKPSIRFVVDGIAISLNFTAVLLRPDDETEQDAVRIDCIIHHKNISERDELIKKLSSWQEYENIMLSNLKSFMGVEQND